MSDMTTITLNTPLTRGDKQITAVELRKPNAGALRGLSLLSIGQMDIDALTRLAPRITSPALTEAEMRQLDIADLFQIGQEIAVFLLPNAAPATSE